LIRLQQNGVKNVLEPEWEARFEPPLHAIGRDVSITMFTAFPEIRVEKLLSDHGNPIYFRPPQS
jgi:hypothetical protein